MTLDKVHSRINFISSKEIGGYFAPAEIDIALDLGQMMCVQELAPFYAVNQTAKEALAPFIHKLSFSTDSAGVYQVAANLSYMKLTSMTPSVTDNNVPAGVPTKRLTGCTIVNEDEEADAYMSQLNQFSTTNPLVVTEGLGKWQFYPEQVHAVIVRFIRRPAIPVFGYTQSGRAITYNSGTSTQLEWNDLFINMVIARALMILGINLTDEKLQQYGLTYPKVQ